MSPKSDNPRNASSMHTVIDRSRQPAGRQAPHGSNRFAASHSCSNAEQLGHGPNIECEYDSLRATGPALRGLANRLPHAGLRRHSIEVDGGQECGGMFERFTENARHVVVLAQEEARMLNHNFIGTEHFLLGLTRDSEGPLPPRPSSPWAYRSMTSAGRWKPSGRASGPRPVTSPSRRGRRRYWTLHSARPLVWAMPASAPSISCWESSARVKALLPRCWPGWVRTRGGSAAKTSGCFRVRPGKPHRRVPVRILLLARRNGPRWPRRSWTRSAAT